MTAAVTITILSKQPPGGRCKLYLAYAEALEATLGATVEVVYPPDDADHQPPGFLANGAAVEPEDFFILNPDDICRGLSSVGVTFAEESLRRRLEEVEEDFMENLGA